MNSNDSYPKAVQFRQGILIGILCLAIIGLFWPEGLVAPVMWAFKQFSPGGLQVVYYKGENFGQPQARRIERQVVRDYGLSSPAWRIPKDSFSARWDGVLIAPKEAEYSFYLQSCNGARLWIDDKLIIDHWNNYGWIPGKSGRAQLSQGRHRIRIEHYNSAGKAALRLRWSGGGIPDNTVLGTPYLLKR